MTEYFLQCEHCGHYNPVKTEYLLFCIRCNHKIKNNFRDWHSAHPEKQFIDFLHETCETLPNKTDNISKKPRAYKIKLIISIFTGVLMLSPMFIISGYNHLSMALPFLYKNPSSQIDKEDEEYVLPLTGIRLYSPVNIQMAETSDLPNDSPVEKFTSFTGEFSDAFYIMINEVRYKNDFCPELNQAARGAMQELKSRDGIVELNYHQKNVVLNNLYAIYIEGVYSNQGLSLSFVHVLIKKDTAIVQIMIVFEKKYGQEPLKLIRKIINKIRFSE